MPCLLLRLFHQVNVQNPSNNVLLIIMYCYCWPRDWVAKQTQTCCSHPPVKKLLFLPRQSAEKTPHQLPAHAIMQVGRREEGGFKAQTHDNSGVSSAGRATFLSAPLQDHNGSAPGSLARFQPTISPTYRTGFERIPIVLFGF